jgi:hypothetical protein
LFLIATGCDVPDRVGKLEKQTSELRAEVEKARSAADLDSQAKCSKDAKAWFKEGWSADKDTLLLDYRNHYSKSQNKCFVLVQYNRSKSYREGRPPIWINSMILYDVYENVRYGDFAESHSAESVSGREQDKDHMLTCEFMDKTCKTLQEFNNLVRPYLND